MAPGVDRLQLTYQSNGSFSVLHNGDNTFHIIPNGVYYSTTITAHSSTIPLITATKPKVALLRIIIPKGQFGYDMSNVSSMPLVNKTSTTVMHFLICVLTVLTKQTHYTIK